MEGDGKKETEGDNKLEAGEVYTMVPTMFMHYYLVLNAHGPG